MALLKSNKFCAVIAAVSGLSATGDEIWVVTHACGKVERRMRRKRGTRHERRAPKRVACVKEVTRTGAEAS